MEAGSLGSPYVHLCDAVMRQPPTGVSQGCDSMSLRVFVVWYSMISFIGMAQKLRARMRKERQDLNRSRDGR